MAVKHLAGQHDQRTHGRRDWSSRLAEQIASGVARFTQLSDPDTNQNDVRLVEFNAGGSAVYKDMRAWAEVGDSAKGASMLDAEELAVPIGELLGLRVPAVHRSGPLEAYYTEVTRGELGVEIYDKSRRELLDMLEDLDAAPDDDELEELQDFELAELAVDALAQSEDGIRMGLLDLLSGNVDRNPGNWFADGDTLIPIDHGQAWWASIQPDGRPPLAQSASPFIAHFAQGDAWADNPLSAEYAAHLRDHLAELRPEFERLGHLDWHDYTMSVADSIAAHAKGSVSL